ncbi:MAG: MFS transporter [Candidatus Bipolaricaulota bacterium]|nr:MAG: MFS transporter [Candidatus Bipolaricaulota bacterium]
MAGTGGSRSRYAWGAYDRQFWILLSVQLIVAVGFGAAMPFVSIYLHNRLGAPMTLVGTIMLVSALAASVGRIVGGELSDRFGRRPLMVAGMLLRVVAFLAMAFVIHRGFPVLAVGGIFLVVRFAGAIVRPALMATVADIVGPQRRVEAYALFRIGSNAGWAVGPAIGGFLVSSSYASLFLLTAAASFVGFVMVLLFTRETMTSTSGARLSLTGILEVRRDRRFLVFIGWSALLFLVMGQFASTLGVFSTSVLGISEAQLGLLFTINGAAVVLLQWPAARVASRIGLRWGLVLGCMLYAAGYFSVAFAPGFAVLVLSMLIITSGEVVFSPTSTAAVANMAPEERIGRYMGLFGLTEAVGWSAGPFVGGVLFDLLHRLPIAMWGAVGVMGTTAAAGFGVTMRGHAHRAEDGGDAGTA